MNQNTPAIDSLSPAEMSQKAAAISVKKVGLDTVSMFLLAFLAGAYIALGAVFATTIATGGSALPYGVNKLLTGLVFSLGLILVVVGGAELFTGNNLLIIGYFSRKISLRGMLRNWSVVYLGNFVGSLTIAALMFFAREYTLANGAVGLTALNIGIAKTSLGFVQAIALGILCNILVCLAVWLTFSARTTGDKILAIIAPITAFVAAGFEHSVANMYFVPMALFIKNSQDITFFSQIGQVPADFPSLTWGNFLVSNLLPVTIGNIIGGAGLVGALYWLIYLRNSHQTEI